MTPAELSRTVLRSVRGAVEEQELSVTVPARIVVEPPPRPGCGDYASNVALQLAGPAGRPAREVAEILRRRLDGSAGIARVEIAGPGFLNFTLGDGALVALVREVLAQGDGYGGPSAGQSPGAPGPVAGSVGGGAREVVVAEVLARIDAVAGVVGGREADGHPVLVPAPYDLATLIARLGSDEARWVLLRPAAHDAVRVPERPVQRESNPRFQVQYAYARVRALVRNADDLGFVSEPGDVGLAPTLGGATPAVPPTSTAAGAIPAAPPATAVDGASSAVRTGARRQSPRHSATVPPALSAPSAPSSLQALRTLLATYPSVIEVAARLRAPDRVVRHLEATAEVFFRWHDVCPPLPVGEQKPLAVHRARLALAEASGTVLANGLRLLGISAPAHL
ncbi:ArgS-related anticodon-binding protein NrtL [Streptomyces caniferus]|uniref:ArgS-related anticodon-binding protein NrtL n=1 Tax=Streptomyces caniferus TaxID=285557 RepID=UPI00381F7623